MRRDAFPALHPLLLPSVKYAVNDTGKAMKAAPIVPQYPSISPALQGVFITFGESTEYSSITAIGIKTMIVKLTKHSRAGLPLRPEFAPILSSSAFFDTVVQSAKINTLNVIPIMAHIKSSKLRLQKRYKRRDDNVLKRELK